MIKFFVVYLVLMLFLSGIWFSLKESTQTPEQRKSLLKSILYIGALISVAGAILFVIVVLF